jgi:N4-gp56 family major capsid protein
MSIIYGSGTSSSINASGTTQFNTYEYKRKALIETAKAEYFGMLGDTESLTKNFGQKIKKYHYLPMLDDRNINDQGLDATGAAVLKSVTITVTGTLVGTLTSPVVLAGSVYSASGTGADDATALASAQAAMIVKWGVMGYNISSGVYATIAAIVAADGGAGNMAISAAAATTTVVSLYGSSKNPGTITGKLPTLSESGGRVNRVGFKRIELEGDIANYGFFYEWSKDSMDFDTDKDLYTHINRESVRGAKEISEDILQMDLLAGAGVIKYAGDATSLGSIGYNGTAALNSVVTYDDLVRLGVTLDDNRCPKDTKAVVGSRDTDVLNIQSARYMFIGSELIPTIMRMTDYFSGKAFVPVEKYANSGTDGKYVNTLHGEIGSVAGFRIIVVPEMMSYAGKGEVIQSAGLGYLNDGVSYNVYPMLAVGSGSFANIKFQSSGNMNDKFNIIVRKPGTFANADDPFEKIGYSSIQFWQGTMILRPEWIAKVLTMAIG